MTYFLAGAFIGGLTVFLSMALVLCANDEGRVNDKESEGDDEN